MKEPLVYIILLVWNGYEDTIECIESLLKITYKSYKIVIVDNASTNNSVEILKKRFPTIKLLVNKENLGFSGGCNVGIKYALKNNADYVLLLNNDTSVDKNFLSELVKVGEENKDIGILSPFIYYKDKQNTIWSSGLNLDLKIGWPFVDSLQKKIDNGQYKTIRTVDFLTGCSMLIKKNVFVKVGLFRKEYFLYIEDMDFSVRAKKNNFYLCSVPMSKIWHKVGRSSSQEGLAKVRYYFARNLLLFVKYNYSWKRKLLYGSFILYLKCKEIVQYIKTGELNVAGKIIIGMYHGLIGRTGYYK